MRLEDLLLFTMNNSFHKFLTMLEQLSRHKSNFRATNNQTINIIISFTSHA